MLSGYGGFALSGDGRCAAVSRVDTGSGTFAVGATERLFQIVTFYGWTYAVSAGGERFLVREPLAEREASPLTIRTDWPSLVENP